MDGWMDGWRVCAGGQLEANGEIHGGTIAECFLLRSKVYMAMNATDNALQDLSLAKQVGGGVGFGIRCAHAL
jgi:hypothetical protein